MREREISIIDLTVDILLHWRMFIVWMLAGAVLSGLYSFILVKQQIQQIQIENIAQEPGKWLSETEIQNVNYAVSCETAYQAKKAYQAESLLMRMDFNHVGKAEATIAIMAKDRLKGCDIAKVYEDIVQSSELAVKVAEDTDMEISDASELISLAREAENLAVEDSESTPTFRLIIIYNDEMQCKNILEIVISFLEEKQLDIESILGEHELTVVNKSFGLVSDTEVAILQKTAFSDVAAMKNVASDAEAALSERERQYYKILMNEKETAPAIGLKYIIFGAVLAAFIYAFILFMSYIFYDKIRAVDNLQELYNISQLGTISTERNYKKFLGFIDKRLISVRYHNKRQFTSEEALELAVVAVKLAAGKEMLHEICLIGCGLKEKTLDTCEKIKAQLEEDGIQVIILNNVLYNAQAMKELNGAKGAVLVEGVGRTLYNEINEELELLKRQEIKVLGGVLVE